MGAPSHPSTAIACELLQPKSAERILDACAAPGGKTSYLAELMNNEGSLITVDREPDRLRLLGNNLNRLKVTIATSGEGLMMSATRAGRRNIAPKVSPARTTKSPTATAGFDQSTRDNFGGVRSADTGLPRSPNLLGQLRPDRRLLP